MRFPVRWLGIFGAAVGSVWAADGSAALERLGDLGLIPSQIVGLRPWSAAERRRQLEEARARLWDDDEAAALVRVADEALGSEASGGRFQISSVYLRMAGIAGEPLADGWHLGQTWSGDYGRPYGEGINAIWGLTAEAQWKRVFGALRAEEQHAEAPPLYSAPVRALMAKMDGVPEISGGVRQACNRVRILEGYAGVRLGNVALSVGKQALWWGPTYDTPLSFSSNAEPTMNFKVSGFHPFHLPAMFRRLGWVQMECVLGRLSGHSYTWRPWFNAQKVAMKLTPNLEVGFTRWSIFWGVGHPITLRSFFRNFASLTSPPAKGFWDPKDPGDRKGGFDFRYRLPVWSRQVILYADSYSEDDPSPLAAPRRAAISPGIHLVRLPALRKLDFRAEAASTEPLGSSWNLNYYNNQYRSGNTNQGQLLGSWVGRAGRAIQGWVTYRRHPDSGVELGFRQQKVDAGFLPGGATNSRASLQMWFPLNSRVAAVVFLQAQRYWIPAVGGPRRTFSGWLELHWKPKLCWAAGRK